MSTTRRRRQAPARSLAIAAARRTMSSSRPPFKGGVIRMSNRPMAKHPDPYVHQRVQYCKSFAQESHPPDVDYSMAELVHVCYDTNGVHSPDCQRIQRAKSLIPRINITKNVSRVQINPKFKCTYGDSKFKPACQALLTRVGADEMTVFAETQRSLAKNRKWLRQSELQRQRDLPSRRRSTTSRRRKSPRRGSRRR